MMEQKEDGSVTQICSKCHKEVVVIAWAHGQPICIMCLDPNE